MQLKAADLFKCVRHFSCTRQEKIEVGSMVEMKFSFYHGVLLFDFIGAVIKIFIYRFRQIPIVFSFINFCLKVH